MNTVLRPNSRTPGDSNISPNVPRIQISCPKNDRHSSGQSVSASLSPSRGAAPPPLLRSLHLTCFNLRTRPPGGLPLRPRLVTLYLPRCTYICYRILLPPFLPGHQLVLTLLSTLFLPHPCSTWVTPSHAQTCFCPGLSGNSRGPHHPATGNQSEFKFLLVCAHTRQKTGSPRTKGTSFTCNPRPVSDCVNLSPGMKVLEAAWQDLQTVASCLDPQKVGPPRVLL